MGQNPPTISNNADPDLQVDVCTPCAEERCGEELRLAEIPDEGWQVFVRPGANDAREYKSFYKADLSQEEETILALTAS